MRKLRSEDFTMFSKSKPWGYHPIMVEEKIKVYEKTIQDLTNALTEAKENEMNLSQKIDRLQDELQEMHHQMTLMELPDASEAVEHFVLDDFKNYNQTSNTNVGINSNHNKEDSYETELEYQEPQSSNKLPFTIVK